jgi:hypothetical protein
VVITMPKQIGSAKPGQVLDAVSGQLLVFGGVDAHADFVSDDRLGRGTSSAASRGRRATKRPTRPARR